MAEAGTDNGWTAMPTAVSHAQLLCYLVLAGLAIFFLLAVTSVIDPQGGFTRAEAVTGTVAALVVAGPVLATSQALGDGKRWSWAAGTVVCILGILAGLALIAAFTKSYVDARVAARGQPTYGADIGAGLVVIAVVLGAGVCFACVRIFLAMRRSESRRWFGL
jgi:hypothetical protein